jgi:hypothetical protein
LGRLFDRYNLKYFDGRLSGWTVGCTNADRTLCRIEPNVGGLCCLATKRISIDIENWWTSWDLRMTMIHEMAHAASFDESHWGDGAWFAEMERLKRAGAPAHSPTKYLRSLRKEAL